MNCRERLTAAGRGGQTDRAPWFAWFPNASYLNLLSFAREYKPDAIVTSSHDDATSFLDELGSDGPAVLFEVVNPYGLALVDDLDLNAMIQADPYEGHVLHAKYSTVIAETLEWAMDAGCDGVFYRLLGAAPQWSTPMQYGGHHLGRDRDLLDSVNEARFNVVYVDGGPGVYLDFVSDLPASAFAWDEAESGISPSEVRELRMGTIACGLFGDKKKLWKDFDATGLVFFARSTFDADFEQIALECNQLRSHAPHE